MIVGDSAEISRVYALADVRALGTLTGAAAGTTVPEPLIAALFSYLLGVRLPGFGTNYLKQDLRFVHPAPLGIPLTARVTVTRLRPDKHLVDLATTCTLPDGTLICDGRALVLAKDVASP